MLINVVSVTVTHTCRGALDRAPVENDLVRGLGQTLQLEASRPLHAIKHKPADTVIDTHGIDVDGKSQL